jgi:pheromone shutdown-related protein TraB
MKQDGSHPDPAELPNSVRRIQLGDREIYLVGTAHVSKESVEDVRQTIAAVQPDTVCVELCPARYEAMMRRDAWEKMDIFKVLRERKAALLLGQLLMTAFYRKLGQQLGVQPGAEMMEGIEQARATGAELVCADRDIQITLKRVWGNLGFWTKLRLVSEILAGLLMSEKIDEELIEKLKEQDQLEVLMEEFSEKVPGVRERLIDERDIFLAQKIRASSGRAVVAVVGAGHCPGIARQIGVDHDLAPLMETPAQSILPKMLGWGIPLLIVAMIVSSFLRNGVEHSVESIWIWVLANGVLSALGAAAALGHPLTIASSFVAAPLTSLNPTIAAGWVAGLVQALVRKPTVSDIEKLPNDIATFKGFWTNPLIRILLVVVLANLGSALGTWVAGVWIFNRSI